MTQDTTTPADPSLFGQHQGHPEVDEHGGAAAIFGPNVAAGMRSAHWLNVAQPHVGQIEQPRRRGGTRPERA